MLRIYSLPVVNWIILVVYLFNLLELSLKFKSFYASFALGTTILTNLLLLGLSDSLAQSLRSIAKFKETNNTLDGGNPAEAGLLHYVLDHGRPKPIWLDEEGDNLAELGLVRPVSHDIDEDYLEPNDEHRFTDFDFRRLFLFSLWGCLVSFFQSPWYGFLRSAYSRDAKLITVVQRVLADQLFYSPIMLACFLLYLAVVVESKPCTIIWDPTFWKNYVHTLGVNLCVWPLAQFVNFLIIPSPAQIPFSSSLSVLWNTYLSLNTK